MTNSTPPSERKSLTLGFVAEGPVKAACKPQLETGPTEAAIVLSVVQPATSGPPAGPQQTVCFMMDSFFNGDYGTVPTNVPAMLLGLLLAFACGHVIAWVYMLTHSGLSYSRSFVNALIIMPTIVSLVMGVLANNILTAFGMMAVFAIVRFRNILRDTLDTTYILIVLVIGMACGTQKYPTAVIGCLITAAGMLYLWTTAFGSRHRYDLIVNLHWARPLADLPELSRTLHRHSRRSHCASKRTHEGYEGHDLSYRILLRDSNRVGDLETELRATNGVSRVTSMQAEEESEV